MWLGLLVLVSMTGIGLISFGVLELVQAGASSPQAINTVSDRPNAEVQTPVPEGDDETSVPVSVPRSTLPRPAPAMSVRMIIERIGVDATIATFGLDEDGLPQVPLNGEQVAWYDFSAWPGAGSNAVFAGHLNWEGAPGVFADLKDLQVGDKITLVTEVWERTYTVTNTSLVDPADPASLRVMKPTETDTVTLITCGGTWIPDPSELFGGDYANRVIVQAEQLADGNSPLGF